MTVRPRSIVALACAVTIALMPAIAAADTAFEDQTCPNVTPLGRHLNEIVDASKTLTDDLVAAAAAMVAGYRECMNGYDHDQYNNRNDAQGQVTNATAIGRLYARLGLARSLERVGIYAYDGKKYADARADYVEAVKWIDSMQTLAEGASVGDSTNSPQGRLLTKGADLKKTLQADVAQLPPV